MSIHKIHIETVIENLEQYLIIDVRSEGEYFSAHIPTSISLPIFNNEERKIIGTSYKKDSRENAIKLGLNFFGPKMTHFITQMEEILQQQNGKKIVLHCWRGGMRSSAMAWLFNFYGIEISLLEGGYKAYRNWCLEQFKKDYPIAIISGCTGAAKTEIIDALDKENYSTIDLEAIASHKGSAFGYLGMPSQPTQEYFENQLALHFFIEMNKQPDFIFIEDESQRIGNLQIPNDLWATIKTKNRYFFDIPFEDRLQHIVAEYSVFNKEELIACIHRITKNLGGLNAKNCIQFIEENKISECFRILLQHYDKAYIKGIQKNENWEKKTFQIVSENSDPIENSKKLKEIITKKCQQK